ncbi:MAG TPA: GntR family transcriptional regulator, partial [Acidimicrobiales bacterium]|nr:GntR family transcriptional regulator [Acidimicrobiales bacterium]
MSGNTLREEIATQLRERILTGAMDRGMRLDLDLLAADFSASRTPVREALLLLAREGLVEFNPRQSSVVIGVTAADIRDIYFVFGALQGLAAAAAARTREPALLERL